MPERRRLKEGDKKVAVQMINLDTTPKGEKEARAGGAARKI